jgi:TonB-linked SusC/RagA family outer membrane protein
MAVLSLFGNTELRAQQSTVSGLVTSKEDGTPLPGVNIVVKGTNDGTSTDADGRYSLNVPEAEAVLVFTFIGLATQEVAAGGRSIIDVQMEPDVNQLSEVLVVAYGEQTQRSIVGSVASVDSEVIGKQQIVSVANAIQGSVPGVNIISSGGQPGDNPTIRIRGVGSINASADPLIIVDGMTFNGNLNTISPDQIESINVLKDASSSALYGSRAANGVLLITTKKGKRNSPAAFSFNTSYGVASQAVEMHDMVGSDRYMELAWEAVKNNYQYIDEETAADAAQMASDNLITDWLSYNPYGVDAPVGPDGRLVTTNKMWDTDWRSHIQNSSAARRDYAFNVSGGTDKTTYFFAANYLTQEGSIQTSDFNRFSARVKVDSKINDWFSVGLNTAYSTQDQNYPEQAGTAYQSAIQWVYTVPSIYPLHRRDENGELILDGLGNKIYDYGNAVGQMLNGSRPSLAGENAVGALYNYAVEHKRDNTTANAYAQIDFTDYLSFRTNVGYEKYLYDGFEYAHNEFGYAANVSGRVSQDRDVISTLTFFNTLNFNKSFGEHTLDVSLIQEALQTDISAFNAQGTGFLPNVKVLNGSTTPEDVGGYITEDRMSSYLGRVSYNFRDKYYLEGSIRTDGSTRFGADNRWGTFFSVGGAWVISDEAFLENAGPLSFLKLKASYGELGNNRADNPHTVEVDGISYFPYLQLFETGWNQGPFTGVLLGDVRDRNLRWEKTASLNFGLEMRFLNDRLGANVVYYDRESVDLIYDQPLAPSTGNSTITTNVGAIRNYGLEVTLSSTNIRNANLTWTTSLNFSRDRNEITELTQDGFISGTKRWEVGRSLYDFYIQEWAGVNPENGYGMWYRDVLDDNGEPTGERETTETYSDATRYYQDKSSLPDFIGGFSNYVRWGNFDLNLLLNFSFGSYIYDSQYARLMGGFETPGDGAGSVDLENRWTQPGDVTDVPLLLASNNDFISTSSRFLFKNDYVRLRALNFGYNLPKALIERFEISNLRVYFQGDNLLTFQSHKGLDPEQSLTGVTDNRSFNQKIVSLGLNLTF